MIIPCDHRKKSAVFFAPNSPINRRQFVKERLGILVQDFSDRYLGLPSAVGRINSGTFDHIGERARSKIRGWLENILPCAGKDTLLKSMIQAIPTYSMIRVRLTKKVCKDTRHVWQKNWWSNSLTTDLCIGCHGKNSASPKITGVMGVRDLEILS